MNVTKWEAPSGRIWTGAEQFFHAGEALSHDAHFGMSRLVYPIIVNYALSVELAMKSTVGETLIEPPTQDGLIPAASIKSAVKVRSHKLKAIFEDLPPQVQALLATEFSIFTGEEALPLLARCNDYFVMARYAHEQKGGAYDLSGLRNLAFGMLAAARNVGLIAERLPPVRPESVASS